ncbi:MAG: galactokinase [Oscillospiraceae bacterium]|nr:galactokinase [Oscillospiraceae bacterium]
MIQSVFTPGRTELAGNHTDHQNGRNLAGAIDRGITARFQANNTKTVRLRSKGMGEVELRCDQLQPRTSELGTPAALTRGMLAVFSELGLAVGGFDAELETSLPVGAGLSSSAAFSVTVGKILSQLFNGGAVDPVVIARAGQQAENRFFGKPCGLMSQLTCALGKTIYVDLKTGVIEPVEADFDAMGLTLCLTDTGGSHAGLDTSYARIPADMVYIANLFDKGVLADVDPAEFRARGWDPANRPVRRAMHFFDENERVPQLRDALREKDAEAVLRLMNESGRSSETLLNNIVTSATGDTKLKQGLELSEKLLAGKGAWRVHGGGFAGCVQAVTPAAFFEEYKTEMEKTFGAGSCMKIMLL